MPDIVVMFFLLGVLAGVARSDLKVPAAAYDTLSILLMLALGLKGGIALHGQMSWQLLPQVLAVLAVGSLIPFVLYPLLRKAVKLTQANAASVAAHYGSASAGTFAVALTFTEALGLPIAPQTTLYLVLLELPAIIAAILLHRRVTNSKTGAGAIWHEALTSRGVLLLVGGVLIGYWYGPTGTLSIAPLFIGSFKALLALFLLDMGLCVSKHLYPLPWHHWRLIAFALLAPVFLAVLGLGVGLGLGLPLGTTLILGCLVASASYIAAPAAIRTSIKDADIGISVFAALGVTFPFNVLVGIPLYSKMLAWVTG
jgi:uncharacterized protein